MKLPLENSQDPAQTTRQISLAICQVYCVCVCVCAHVRVDNLGIGDDDWACIDPGLLHAEHI